ncbi:MAG: hypothetical protein ABIG96_01645 [Candidatus Micrarchaeota archaeon]
MAGALDFTIMSLVLLLAFTVFYFAALIILMLIYSLIRYGSSSFAARNWFEAVKAALIAAVMNNISMAIIALIVLNEFVKGGIAGINAGIGIVNSPAAITEFAAYAAKKMLVLSSVSVTVWLIASAGICFLLVRRKERKVAAKGRGKN